MVYPTEAKSSLAFALCALLLTCAPAAQASAITSQITPGRVARAAGVAAVGIGVWQFFSAEPCRDPIHWNKELFMKSPIEWLKSLKKMSNAERRKELSYFWKEGVWGRRGKGSSMKTREDGSINCAPACDPVGLGGFIDGQVKPLGSTAGFLLATSAFSETLMKGGENILSFIMTGELPKKKKEVLFQDVLNEKMLEMLAEKEMEREPKLLNN